MTSQVLISAYYFTLQLKEFWQLKYEGFYDGPSIAAEWIMSW